MPPPISVPSLTNPLTIYRSLLATKQIDPDPSQHRLAIHLQKLYFRLLDYSPQVEYGKRLQAISKTLDQKPNAENESAVAAPGHPLRRNPLFAHLFVKKEERDTLALTRVLTSYEEAINLKSPQGLLLHGEVGSGKSMLVDLLADGLPTRKKQRWHFNTFMLETLARLEQLRRSRAHLGLDGAEHEHSLLWLAKDMVEKSPILFLDEFQLPDRAASKILSNLLTNFFQLGGVLIATSNRMPDELSKASGVDFATPSRGGIMKNLFGVGRSSFPANREYAGFVEVLKARCEIWNIEGSRDWRRREAEEETGTESMEVIRKDIVDEVAACEVCLENGSRSKGDITLLGTSTEAGIAQDEPKTMRTIPKNYLLSSSSDEEAWNSAVVSALSHKGSEQIAWQSSTLHVYGRQVPISQHLDGVTYWTFQDLCGGSFGPADYITLASTFHTLILDSVPILALSQKNEARRLITLLDALYEARCKLIVRAAAGPDDLFFPETKTAPGISEANDGADAVYPETLSEIYQDQTSPFRPNISSYTDEPKSGFDPDEDSGFGPIGKNNEHGLKVDFRQTGSFTGEDERFAYKRARSRLWEMCGTRWHKRSEAGWWRPVPAEVRRWERSAAASQHGMAAGLKTESDVKLGDFVELDRPAGLQGKELEESEAGISSPSREKREPPKEIGWTHAWGIMKWGKKAGAWGEGVEGLDKKKGNRDK